MVGFFDSIPVGGLLQQNQLLAGRWSDYKW
jgi:hypothetical protein